MAGKMNVEVRPRVIGKGESTRLLVEEFGETGGEKSNGLQFVLCLGDDSTDEDMFRAIKHADLEEGRAFSVVVGESSKQTLADWHLLEPGDVVDTIAGLCGMPKTA
jgi:trehalose 6-phosphate synthase/phosphatase